jgi:molecular chaperone HscB
MPDPFDTLGVEARFDLSDEEIDERHRALSGALHPDRYSGKPASERRLALDKAIAVNGAWRLLLDPIRRAEALLARRGVETGEGVEPKASPALLMDMMEVRESLGEARAQKNLGRIGELAAEMRQREQRLVAQIARTFDDAGDDATQLRAIVPLVGELRYVRRFFEELDAIEDELLD